MSNTRRDICVPRKKSDGGTYWVKIGTAWEGQKGTQLVFDALPIPDAEGRCVANLFEPRESTPRKQENRDDMTRAYSRDELRRAAAGEYDEEDTPF